jgi:chromosome segregation ATPase
MVHATTEWWAAQLEALEKQIHSLQKELVLSLNSLETQNRELESKLAKERLRVSDLEMALDLARSKAITRE